jgi:hypothetical protein
MVPNSLPQTWHRQGTICFFSSIAIPVNHQILSPLALSKFARGQERKLGITDAAVLQNPLCPMKEVRFHKHADTRLKIHGVSGLTFYSYTFRFEQQFDYLGLGVARQLA